MKPDDRISARLADATFAYLLRPENLAATLRNAGYDVRDVARDKDGVWLETDPETADGFVVLPIDVDSAHG